MTGFLGEVAFEKTHENAKYVGGSSFTHDYELGKLTVDIKAKVCTSPPRLHYVGSVFPKKDGSLPADVYYFVRVLKDFSKVWLCGWSTAKGIAKPKYWRKKGETDDFGFTFLGDGYHLPIRQMRRPDAFPRLCRRLRTG